MNTYILYALGLAGVYLVYYTISSILASRYHARRAVELGCKPAFQRPYKWPLGIDMAKEIMDADKQDIVPTYIHTLFENGCQKKPTWEQNFLGKPNFFTADPKNIQAMLATQFNDFCLGHTRRDNFMPLLGNGIFTSDGKVSNPPSSRSPPLQNPHLTPSQPGLGTLPRAPPPPIRPRPSLGPRTRRNPRPRHDEASPSRFLWLDPRDRSLPTVLPLDPRFCHRVSLWRVGAVADCGVAFD
jgi:hypothetical protein